MAKTTKGKRQQFRSASAKAGEAKGKSTIDQQKWNKRFIALQAYKRKKGNCDVPARYPPNPQLASWVQTQRKLYKRGKLSDDCLGRLERLGFSWDRREDSWEEHFKELKAYKRKNGDCNVPTRYPEDLGKWVDTQRQNYKRGKLLENRVERLNRLGFTWVLSVGRRRPGEPADMVDGSEAKRKPSRPKKRVVKEDGEEVANKRSKEGSPKNPEEDVATSNQHSQSCCIQ